MFGIQSSSSRRRMVRLSVLGLAFAIWFQGCSCDDGSTTLFPKISVPVKNVGNGSGTVDIPQANNEKPCTLGPAGGTPASCTVTFEDAGGGGSFLLSPTPSTGSVFVAWVGGPCSGLPTTCGLSFTQGNGDFTFAEVTVDFSIPPTITQIDPSSASSGAAPVNVNATITGTSLTGATAVTVTGGITTSNLQVVSPTQLTVTLTIPAGNSGSKSVTVTTPAGTTNVLSFSVSVPPPPTLTNITPNTGVAGGTPFDVTFDGTGFDATVTMSATPGTIQFSNFRVLSPTKMIATVTVPAGIVTGPHPVAVTTQFGTSNSLFFQVTGPVPALASLVPSSGEQGAVVPVRLLGSNFVAVGTTVSVTGAGITVSPLTFVSSTEVDATFTISPTAGLGSRNVSITVPNAGTSNTLPFDVVAPPSLTLTSITPSGAAFGQTVNVTIVGTGFGPGLTLNIAGVTVTNLVIVDSTHLTATFSVLDTTFFGDHDLTATIGSVTSNIIHFNIV